MLLKNWPVRSEAITALMSGLFKRQAENPTMIRAQALSQAMIGLVDGKGFLECASG